ncbi:replication-relaxation family protein [Actinomadura sp. 3N508]|uniref:replication-relaxation family protein n=1 Tax=Actinomadura sp. 3N508 TaxID=3375153 RepID=UPI0037BD68FA
MTTRYVPPVPPSASDAATATSGLKQLVPMLLASRLTQRDHYVLRALWDHHVLTTRQIAQLAYPNADRARRGMLRLTNLGAVERFRPLLPPGRGTAPLHYTIGEAGAYVIAADQGIPFADLGYRRDRILAWALSPQLAHLIGVNGIFTALAAAARHHPAADLVHWWPERRCSKTWAPYIRPDGYGRWCEHGVCVDFFVEYDTGTQRPLKKVVDKLRGYANLATADGFTTPVLIWTSSQRRETNLHAAIGTPPVPVFTTTPDAIRDKQLGPAGPIWLHATSRGGPPRLRLSTLARYARPFPPHGDTNEEI